jgi:transcriptional regulator with XRE-family HTH domain
MLLSDKLKELREQKKLPQRKVAAALDIDTATYSKIENGKYVPNRDFVLRLSYFFEYDSEQFIKLWLADRLMEVAKDEDMAKEAMKLAADLINEEKENP